MKKEYHFENERKPFFVSLLVSMAALMATSSLLPGITIHGFFTVFVSALVIGLINAIIKPIFTILTLPLTVLTFGLFLFVLNGIMLEIAAAIVPGFYVASLGSAILGSIVITFFTWIINKVL